MVLEKKTIAETGRVARTCPSIFQHLSRVRLLVVALIVARPLFKAARCAKNVKFLALHLAISQRNDKLKNNLRSMNNALNLAEIQL
jgi:hypothetical protein